MSKLGLLLTASATCLFLGEALAAWHFNRPAYMPTLRELFGGFGDAAFVALRIPAWVLDQKAFLALLAVGTVLLLLRYLIKPARR